MTADEARTYLQYSTWASRRLLDAAFALDPEQLHRDLKVSHKSVHGTLEHILIADRIWLSRVLGEPVETPGALAAELPRIRERWEALANGWTDADIERVVEFQRPDGVIYTLVLRDIILHAVNHATLHRGQVISDAAAARYRATDHLTLLFISGNNKPLMHRLSLALLFTAFMAAQDSNTIRVWVDETDAPHKMLHAHLTIPAKPGPMTLLYPEWIPGEHGPTGPEHRHEREVGRSRRTDNR